MIKHYIKMAIRNISAQKFYSGIMIGGLSVGMAVCMLIALYIMQELSYDSNNRNGNQVYRLVGEIQQDGEWKSGVSFPAPMAKALKLDFPEVEEAGRIMSNRLFGGTQNQIRRPDQSTNSFEKGFCFADPAILDILDIRLIYGNSKEALKQPNSVVLCKSLAEKFFPNQDPVGKALIFNNNQKDLIYVGAVMPDFPPNSHLQYRAFISLEGVNFWKGEQETWAASNYAIYLKLRKDTNIQTLQKRMTDDVIEQYMIPMMKQRGDVNASRVKGNAKLRLQPLADIHLRSYSIQEDPVKHGDIRRVWIFTGIAAFILIMACINFINLATARSAKRAKEVGVRKAIGSSRGLLVGQFITESIMYSLFSFVIAFALCLFILPGYNRLMDIQISIPADRITLIAMALLCALLLGVLAGIYPAFYLSYFKPVQVLKGNFFRRSGNAGLRSVLVVFQFSVTALLLIGTFTVYRQMNYILFSDPGFEKDHVVIIEGARALGESINSFKGELNRLSLVKDVSVSDYLPIDGTTRNGNPFWIKGEEMERAAVQGQRWVIDDRYIPLLGMRMIAGRNFSPEMKLDSQAAIINEAMVNKLGLRNPIGSTISNGGESFKIIGVVHDFIYENIKQQIAPVCMVLGRNENLIEVKLKGGNVKNALDEMSRIWKDFIPYQEFRFSFLDDDYAAMYADVQRIHRIFASFSILAILVAFLGLFALTAYMAEQRRKEIGIRKILGASVFNLLLMLTGNFLKLVLLALIIAIPAGIWLANSWLQDFYYRITPGWQIMLSAAISVLAIGLITVLYQSFRAATANPAKSIRIE